MAPSGAFDTSYIFSVAPLVAMRLFPKCSPNKIKVGYLTAEQVKTILSSDNMCSHAPFGVAMRLLPAEQVNVLG